MICLSGELEMQDQSKLKLVKCMNGLPTSLKFKNKKNKKKGKKWLELLFKSLYNVDWFINYIFNPNVCNFCLNYNESVFTILKTEKLIRTTHHDLHIRMCLEIKFYTFWKKITTFLKRYKMIILDRPELFENSGFVLI